MSQWTHVNASIRYDGIPALGIPIITEKELGEISTWENDVEDTILPCGSEGSLEYKLIKTGTENALACRAVIFYGDLRDYSDVDEILAYFESITSGKMIRSGILEIAVEYQDVMIYRFNTSDKKWEFVDEVTEKEH
jgi:hypothetical protein